MQCKELFVEKNWQNEILHSSIKIWVAIRSIGNPILPGKKPTSASVFIILNRDTFELTFDGIGRWTDKLFFCDSSLTGVYSEIAE